MISDPVRGLARRHGSVLQHEQLVPIGSYSQLLADTVRHGVTTFFVDGVEYDLIHRTEASTMGQAGFAFAFNKATRQFIPIAYSPGDTALGQLMSGGVSAATSIGKYLYLAGNDIEPTWTPTDAWGDVANKQHAAVWVRGGAYSRTFKITLYLNNGTSVTASYKTVSASYPQTLDVSDIPVYQPGTTTVDPTYQKKVNDRIYAYNSEVTKWIGTAAQDITPENIAQKLVDQLAAQSIFASRTGSTICIADARIVDVAGDDSGDGSLLRAVGNEVPAAELVSAVHWAGKVVKVRPKHSSGDDAYYLKATPKTPGQTGFVEVTWNESAGYIMQPATVFIMGLVQGGTLYLASTAARLTAMAGGDHPTFKANAVGDSVTCALPQMFGNRIDYLGVFQDRLVIGSGAVLLFSRPGDYFNWFRQSVLTLADNDPWEGYALGAEDDTITSSTTYSRNLILHGKRFWYEVNGRQPFTPKTASISTGSAYKNANTAPPVTAGNFTLYAKYSGIEGKEVSSLHQVQAGIVADDPETTPVSLQLDDYLTGKPVQVVAVESPNVVFLRTEAYRNGLFVYGYLDSASAVQRLLDNWHRWVWDERLGSIVGMSADGQDILVYLLRHNSGGTWIAAERFTLHTALSDYPYADSLRPYSSTLAGYITRSDTAFATACAAFGGGSEYRFLGRNLSESAALVSAYPTHVSDLWVGLPYPAWVTPTNPFLRDNNGQAIMAGRLTLGRVGVTVEDTGGLVISVQSSSGLSQTDFSGRILAGGEAQVGRQPIVTVAVSGTVGREVRECSYTISAKSWLPLTITALEWVGQSFNNVRRV